MLRTGDDLLPRHLGVIGVAENLPEGTAKLLALRLPVDGDGRHARESVAIGIERIVESFQAFQLLAKLKMEAGRDHFKQLAKLLPLAGREAWVAKHAISQRRLLDGEKTLADVQKLQIGNHRIITSRMLLPLSLICDGFGRWAFSCGRSDFQGGGVAGDRAGH